MLGNVITRIDLRGRTLSRRELLEELPRAEVDVEHAAEVVAPILADVRTRGAAALRDLAERFDGVRPVHLRVPAEAIAGRVGVLDPDVRAALEETIRRVRQVHARPASRRLHGRARARRPGPPALAPGPPGRALRARAGSRCTRRRS